jgi:hypothetical protein
MDHKAAFRCHKCPRNNDPQRGASCPEWWEWTAENPQTGEARIERMCGKQALPLFLVEVIKASNRPAAAIESTRNELAAGFGRLAEVLPAALERKLLT